MLADQAQDVLQLMIERGGITKADAAEIGCWNLPGRIYDIRARFGDAAVRTDMVPNIRNKGKHAIYRWVGSDGEQLRLGA